MPGIIIGLIFLALILTVSVWALMKSMNQPDDDQAQAEADKALILWDETHAASWKIKPPTETEDWRDV